MKQTDRYKEAANTLEAAKKKYNPSKVKTAGHSLGAAIVLYLPADKITTLDKGTSIFQKNGKNETSYRTSGDMVSLLNSNEAKTLANPSRQINVGNPLLNFGLNALQSHNVSNIKQSGLFV